MYFNKDAADLTPMEAARLAVALPSPVRLDPSGDGKYLAARAQVVYDIMVRRGIVEPDYSGFEGALDAANAVEAKPESGAPTENPIAKAADDKKEIAEGNVFGNDNLKNDKAAQTGP